jgi:hypothetical protein
MVRSPDNYPIFNVDEVVASRGLDYKEIVPHISSRYFFSNPRFRSLGQISFPRLMDYMGVYEEGNRWTLTIIEAAINEASYYFFLPLTEGIPPDSRNPEYGKPAFGIQTNSPMYGVRQWQVFDAFADRHFIEKLYRLLYAAGGSEDHSNDYTDVQESGIGYFRFHVKHDLHEPLQYYDAGVVSKRSTFVLRLGGYNLEIYQTLPTIDNTRLLEESPDVAGWIDYSGEQQLHLLIGVLYTASNIPL